MTDRPQVTQPQPRPDELRKLGELYFSGKMAETEKKSRQLIGKYPGAVGLMDVLAMALVGQGKIRDAETVCRKALALDPDHADAHCNLGIALQELGQPEEAAASYRRAIAVKAEMPQAHNNLGVVLLALDEADKAVASFNRAIALQPRYADAHSNLGLALGKLNKHEEAVVSLRNAVWHSPSFAKAHTNLGNALRALWRLEESEASHRKALELAPRLAEAHTNLGLTLDALGRAAAAAACHREAVKIEPKLVRAHVTLGLSYERMNDLGRAAESIGNALALAPDDPEAKLGRAILLRHDGEIDEAVGLLDPVLAGILSDGLRAAVHNELGMLHDRLNACGKAFDHFTSANDIQARTELGLLSGEEPFLAEVARMDAVSTPEWMRAWQVPPDAGDVETPAFLVGFPRSGTTLLEQILDAHPAVQVMDEKPAIFDVKTNMASVVGDYPSSIAKLTSSELNALRAAYFESVARHVVRTPGTLLVDKLPLNIVDLPLILRLFPEAKIVLALRHPCDAVLSNFMQRYRLNTAMANFFTIEDAARCYSHVMGLWRKYEASLPMAVHAVRYESLLAGMEEEVRRLVAFLGVGWDESVLEYSAHARQRKRISTPSYHSVTEPIYQHAKYRWKRYDEKLAPVLGTLAPFIDAFGYSEAESPTNTQ